MMKTEADRDKIREFLDLVDNQHYELRKYVRPVLVYKVEENNIYYSLWEEDILKTYGLKNVDGWDYKEDIVFCPDWVTGVESIFSFEDEEE